MTPKWLKQQQTPKKPGMKLSKSPPRPKKMKGLHCHENGMCHDHPDDGMDYG